MSTLSNLQTELQKLAPSALLELFELDLTPNEAGSDNKYYFHAGSNKLNGNIVWQTQSYAAWPVEVTGFNKQAGGALPRVRMKIANVDGLLTVLALNFSDMLGAKLTRHRTFAKFIDAVNFAGAVNPDADPTVELEDDIFFLTQKMSENRMQVELEFAAEFDMEGIMLPRRQVSAGVCPWSYRGTECEYAGKPVANDFGDVLTVTPLDTIAPFNEWSVTTPYVVGSTVWYRDPKRVFVCLINHTGKNPLTPLYWFEDRCGKRVSDCQLRPRAGNVYPYGGFPGAARVPSQ